MSCHLYPIRVKDYSEFSAVNYHKWHICDDACSLGKELQIPIYKFVKEALITAQLEHPSIVPIYSALQSVDQDIAYTMKLIRGKELSDIIEEGKEQFNQEKKEDSDVKKFCEVNFNINFPMTSITEVKGENSHEIFKWAEKNHGKSAVPKWNFHKILINKEGKIEETYNSFTKPMSKKITSKIESLL